MSVDVGSSSAKSDPNVVPLCDILLVLLIIFMVILPAAQKGIDIQLPETQQSTGADEPQPQSKGIVLTLEKDKTLKINREPITMDLLPGRLRDLFQQRSDKTMFIQADKTVLYKDVLAIIDLAKGAGIEVLGVMTQSYESEGQ
jgi:biopolymer transport protein TolR